MAKTSWENIKEEVMLEEAQRTTLDLFGELSQWRRERGLDMVKSNPIIVLKHMLIEITEAMEALHNDDFYEVIDGINDCIVYGINGLEQMGVDSKLAMNETLKEIHSRKGWYNFSEEKFEKNITGNEYKADYSKAMKDKK